jgi:S1-C subfamily serine protease
MKKLTQDIFQVIICGLIIGSLAIFGISEYQKSIQLKNFQMEYNSITTETIGLIANQLNIFDKKISAMPEQIKMNRQKFEEKLKQVNVVIINKTLQASGSGVTIKYKDNFYVLSAGHMVENNTDEIYLKENGTEICQLTVVKHAFNNEPLTIESNDLVLFRPKDRNVVPRIYVELADIEPGISSQLYIVGNPLGLEDIISEARTLIYRGKFMYIKGDSYFGNSGGGIYTIEGKLVGIMSHVSPIQPYPDYNILPKDPNEACQHVAGVPAYVINGVVRLSVIRQFLETITTNWINE